MARDLFDEMEQRFDTLRRELLGRQGGSSLIPTAGQALPPADLIDEGNQYVLTLDVPGVRKEDIDLEVRQNAIQVRARRREESETRQRGYLRHERSSEQFERYLTLPEEINPDNAKARLNNGVLEIELPKAAPTRQRGRRIDIA